MVAVVERFDSVWGWRKKKFFIDYVEVHKQHQHPHHHIMIPALRSAAVHRP